MKRISLFRSCVESTIMNKPLMMLAVLILFAVSSIKAQVPDNTYNPAPRAKGIGYYDTNGLKRVSPRGSENLSQPGSAEEEIFIFPENEPEFPGGSDALNGYFQNNLRYPQLAKDKGIEGRVFISFVVEKDGSITNIKILRDIGGGCGDEAVRIVKSMPKWKPGKMRGKVVRSQFNTSVNFSLPKE